MDDLGRRRKRLNVHVVSMADGGAGRKENEVDAPAAPLPAAEDNHMVSGVRKL